MRIGIDARFLTHPQRGGFKTYVEGLVTALPRVDEKNTYILYLDRAPDAQTKIPKQANFSYRVLPGLLPVIGMPWREQVSLSRQIARDRLDVFHSPCLTAPILLKLPLVVTIHDIIWYAPPKRPGRHPRSIHQYLLNQYYRIVPKYSARSAELVLTDSYSAKEDIHRTLGLDKNKIVVTYLAAGSMFRRIAETGPIAEIRQKFQLPKEFVLGVGASDSRKNIDSLIQAYAKLSPGLREQYPLVIILAHPHLSERLNRLTTQLGIQNQVRLRNRASLDEMALLYNAASLFVFPSLYEGFGMPPLEAMSCGTPVIAANNSSIPEVVGDAALLVQAEDTGSMAHLMTRVLEDNVLRSELREKGLRRAEHFSWIRCGCETVIAYRQAVIPNREPVSTLQENCA